MRESELILIKQRKSCDQSVSCILWTFCEHGTERLVSNSSISQMVDGSLAYSLLFPSSITDRERGGNVIDIIKDRRTDDAFLRTREAPTSFRGDGSLLAIFTLTSSGLIAVQVSGDLVVGEHC